MKKVGIVIFVILVFFLAGCQKEIARLPPENLIPVQDFKLNTNLECITTETGRLTHSLTLKDNAEKYVLYFKRIDVGVNHEPFSKDSFNKFECDRDTILDPNADHFTCGELGNKFVFLSARGVPIGNKYSFYSSFIREDGSESRISNEQVAGGDETFCEDYNIPIDKNVRLGPEEIVFDWQIGMCGDPEITPDAPARAFRDADNNIQLLVSHDTAYRVIGNSFADLALDCSNPVYVSPNSPSPRSFNNKRWLTAPYTEDGQLIYVLSHNEYQGHLYDDACEDYWHCWYNSLSMLKSTDKGESYHKPSWFNFNNLVLSPLFKFQVNVGPAGYFGPSNIIKKDGYYYATYHVEKESSRTGLDDGLQVGRCIMRTNDLSDASSWRFYRCDDQGCDFKGTNYNPYAFNFDSISEHTCTPLSNIGKMGESLTYNTYFGKYLLVGTYSGVYGGGIYYSLSEDLVTWSVPKLIQRVNGRMGIGKEVIGYGVVIDHDDSSRNFEVTDDNNYLYYIKIAPDNVYDRQVIRREIQFLE